MLFRRLISNLSHASDKKPPRTGKMRLRSGERATALPPVGGRPKEPVGPPVRPAPRLRAGAGRLAAGRRVARVGTQERGSPPVRARRWKRGRPVGAPSPVGRIG